MDAQARSRPIGLARRGGAKGACWEPSRRCGSAATLVGRHSTGGVSLADLDRVFRPGLYRMRPTRLTSHEERHAQGLGGVLTHELHVPVKI